MSKKKYLVLFWLKTKNVAMEWCENLDVLHTFKRLYKHDRCEVVDMETFEEKPKKEDPVARKKIVHSKGWATQVRCVETGEIWRSVAECHRRTGYGFFQINSACTTGRDLNGRHYEYYRAANNTSVPSRLDADGDKTNEE